MPDVQSQIEVFETVESDVALHVMPAAVTGNGLLVQIRRDGVVQGRAYVPWHKVAAMEAAIHRMRDEHE